MFYLTVMNVSFASTSIDVVEGVGIFDFTLKKTEGALGPVSIRITSMDGTATEGTYSYVPSSYL